MAQESVLFWNEVALQANVSDHSGKMMSMEQPGPVFSTRVLAIVHGAIYDAVNSFFGKYERYRFQVDGITDPDSAVAGAAITTLKELYKKQRLFFDQKLKEFSTIHELDKVSFNKGVQIANSLLTERENDGSIHSRVDENRLGFAPASKAMFASAAPPCTVCNPEEEPGHHQEFPDGQGCYAERWGEVEPFALDDLKQIEPEPPYALGTAEYYKDFDKVKSKGRAPKDHGERTKEEIYTGLFWAYDGAEGIGTPNRLYNQIARHISEDKGFGTYDNARFFLLINLALGDAGIHSWRSKYQFCLWRPVIGIRKESDPNRVDKSWLPYGSPKSNTLIDSFTPNFPAYPSGHATFGTAAFIVMKRFLNSNYAVRNFMSDELNRKTFDKDFKKGRPHVYRTFTLNVAIRQNLESRIFLGVHWRMDGEEGKRTGEIIGNRVFERIALEVQRETKD